jgi:hypothetical protein
MGELQLAGEASTEGKTHSLSQWVYPVHSMVQVHQTAIKKYIAMYDG